MQSRKKSLQSLPHGRPLAKLALAVVTVLCTPVIALAGNLSGSTGNVGPGDPVEGWTLSNGATLNVNGGTTNGISSQGSRVNIAGGTVSSASDGVSLHNGSTGTITGATITATGGRGLSLSNVGSSPGSGVSSSATVIDSVISGVGFGAGVSSAGTIDLSGTTLIGTDDGSSAPFGGGAGLGIFGGRVVASNGSVITGDKSGVIFTLDNRGSANPDTTQSLVLDDSTVEGKTGSAILVYRLLAAAPSDVDIVVQNGSTLTGGNGNILETTSGSAGGSTVDFTVDNSDLTGNVVIDAASSAAITLRNAASLTGSMTNVTSLAMADSRWTITGDSDVGTLSLGNGTVAFQAPTTGDFKTLTVNGDFSSAGGTLMFNAVLADDASGNDRLHIIGNTSGQANVQVNNVGGVGAQTVNGIQLIQVDGASNGEFTLAGRAVGGQYEYFLFKGGKADPNDGDWYLRSALQTPPNPCLADPSLPGCEIVIPDPCEIDPSLPQCGPIVPVLRPEPGAYLANLRAAEMMFRTDYHSRHDGQNHGRAWARVDGNRNSYDALNRQLDISGNSQALHVGMDLMTNDAGSGFGVMLASGNATSTTRSNLTDYSARGKVRGEALGVYGTLRALAGEDPYAGLYVDGWVQRQQFRNKVEGAGLASERYDSKAWQGAVEAGYAFRLSGDAVRGGLYLEPQVQVGYTDITSDTHIEANGTIVEAQEAGGLFTRAGLRLSGVMRWEGAAAQVQPYLEANWLYNKRDEALLFDNELVDNRIPASKLEIGGGASIKFAGGLGAWAGLAIQSTSGYRSTSAQLGMSYSW